MTRFPFKYSDRLTKMMTRLIDAGVDTGKVLGRGADFYASTGSDDDPLDVFAEGWRAAAKLLRLAKRRGGRRVWMGLDGDDEAGFIFFYVAPTEQAALDRLRQALKRHAGPPALLVFDGKTSPLGPSGKARRKPRPHPLGPAVAKVTRSLGGLADAVTKLTR